MSSHRSQKNYKILRCWVPMTTLKMVYNLNLYASLFSASPSMYYVHSVNMINIARQSVMITSMTQLSFRAQLLEAWLALTSV